MTRKNVRFEAVKVIAKPTTVRFKTKSGQTVSFKAIKTTTKQRQSVRFRAKAK